MAPVHWFGLVLLTAAVQANLFLLTVCRCSDSEHRLIGHLFDSGYNKVIRPVQSRGEVVNVNLQIVFAQLIAVVSTAVFAQLIAVVSTAVFAQLIAVGSTAVFSQLIAVEEREQMMKTNLWLGQDWFDYRLR
ncbi:CHRNB2 [Branchiostoma lanceolatum]|uniref:CHRNB2 protein n=1 Tax=Branchiostoma lanceolatum TaxID=7740 RepID=A0A8J9ZDC0_BRALA|nr:CHRNB2 [Branchiostoma lanceolatum]